MAGLENVNGTEANAGWRPQPRPGWVASLNAVGSYVGPESVIDLSEDSLIAAARRQAGLDDFGDEAWREPFGILVRDLENAELTLTGRVLARTELLSSLTVLLRLAEVERQHPEILEQPIEEPIFITGLGRSGTSILVELVGQDPDLRPGLGWEFRYPSPPPVAGQPDPVRLARAAAEIDLWEQVIPELKAIHETAVDAPDEDSMAMKNAFASGIWSAVHRVPAYEAWAAADNNATGLRFHRRVLQHLQWKKPGRFFLKNPAYLSSLPTLFAEFPDARVVVTHRDPIKVFPSTADMLATLRWQRSDSVDYAEIAQRITTGYPMLLNGTVALRDSGVLPADRIVDIRYADLMKDHLSTLANVYEQLGMKLSDEAAERIRAYLDSKPKGRHGGRSYRFEDLGVDLQEMRQTLAPYMARFDVPEED